MLAGAESNTMFDAILAEDYEGYLLSQRVTKETVPSPNSCAICGLYMKSHGMSSSRNSSLHYYKMPDDLMRLARMKARRNLNLGAVIKNFFYY